MMNELEDDELNMDDIEFAWREGYNVLRAEEEAAMADEQMANAKRKKHHVSKKEYKRATRGIGKGQDKGPVFTTGCEVGDGRFVNITVCDGNPPFSWGLLEKNNKVLCVADNDLITILGEWWFYDWETSEWIVVEIVYE